MTRPIIEMACGEPDDPPRRRLRIDPETVAIGRALGLGVLLSVPLWVVIAWLVL